MKEHHRGVKTALVTGAGRRLGRHIAEGLAKHGYGIIIHYSESEKGAVSLADEVRRNGGFAELVKADLSNLEEVERLAEEAVRKGGGIDLLVNNAGVFREGSAQTVTAETWEFTLAVNLRAPFFLARAMAEHMVARGGGRIVNIASLGGLQPWADHAAYSISKAGIVMATKILAKAYAPTVTVNAIAPGVILMEDENPSVRHVPSEKIPLKRYGMADEILEAVLFLADAANYTTGHILPVDGGRTLSTDAS